MVKWAIPVLTAVLLALPQTARAGAGALAHPERMGLAVTYGHTYDPEPTFSFTQLTGLLQYDYDKVWPNPAPDPLYFKLEGSGGMAHFEGHERLMTSVNMLAQYYLAPAGQRIRPYMEAGIGLIYTDFQVEGQGLRFNFNPQAGLGFDLATADGTTYYFNFRLHHLSNGELYHENRGVNSVLIQVGRYF